MSEPFPFEWTRDGDSIVIHGVVCTMESAEPRYVTVEAAPGEPDE